MRESCNASVAKHSDPRERVRESQFFLTVLAAFEYNQTMSRLLATGLGVVCLLSLTGCQTLRAPVSEPAIDQELTATPVAHPQSSESAPQEPRQGFQQEPSTSQTP